MVLKVNEIFTGIEGEGVDTGLPTLFIRFSGCSRNCRYCDTDSSSFEQYTVEALVDFIQAEFILNPMKINIIKLTGGEPLEQDNRELFKFIINLKKKLITFKNLKIVLETNGLEYNHAIFTAVDKISIDLKLPSSDLDYDLLDVNINNIEAMLNKYYSKMEIKSLVKGHIDKNILQNHLHNIKNIEKAKNIFIMLEYAYSKSFVQNLEQEFIHFFNKDNVRVGIRMQDNIPMK